MRRLPLALLAVLATALTATEGSATAGMVCEALDKSGAFVEMNMPRAAGTPPNWVMVSVPGKEYTTKGAENGEIDLSIKQAFDDGRMFAIDLAPDLLSDPSIMLRILIAQEGDEPLVYVGYLHVVGQGIYPISCIEDE